MEELKLQVMYSTKVLRSCICSVYVLKRVFAEMVNERVVRKGVIVITRESLLPY